jgi:hypothetical protein
MEKNQRNEDMRNERRRSSEQDQSRQSTNENRREVRQDRDMEQNESLRDADQGSGRSYDYGTEGSDMDTNSTRRTDHTSHQNLSSNTGGTVDMGPNSLTGSNNRTSRAGTGSGLNTKRGVTGSDFDGQNKTT